MNIIIINLHVFLHGLISLGPYGKIVFKNSSQIDDPILTETNGFTEVTVELK